MGWVIKTLSTASAEYSAAINSRRFTRRSVALAVAATATAYLMISGVVHATPPPPQRQLDLADAMKVTQIPGRRPLGSFSPDSKWLAYTLTHADSSQQITKAPRGGTGIFGPEVQVDVWIVNIATGENINVSEDHGHSWGPVWSPDGKAIAFFSDRDGALRVWLWDVGLRQTRRLSDKVVRAGALADVVAWTPDSREVLAKIFPEGSDAFRQTVSNGEQGDYLTFRSNMPDVPGLSVFRSPSRPANSPAAQAGLPVSAIELDPTTQVDPADIVAMDVKSGHARRVAQGVRGFAYSLSPDGTMLAYESNQMRQLNSQQSYADLYVIAVRGGAPRQVATRVQASFFRSFSWSPDSSRLAYTYAGVLASGDAFITDINGGEPRRITAGNHPLFNQKELAPVWTPDGIAVLLVGAGQVWRANVAGLSAQAVTPSHWDREVVMVVPGAEPNVAWSQDSGRSIDVITCNKRTMQYGFFRVNLATGQTTALMERDQSFSSTVFPQALPDSKSVVFLSESSLRPEAFWIADADFRHPRQLTHADAELDLYTFGRSQLIRYENARGEKLNGALLLPSNYESGKRYPLVVWVYPGPYQYGRRVNRFGLEGSSAFGNLQMLATRGYAVLLPEAPQRVGSPMQDLTDAVLPAIERVVELGVADVSRVGVIGHSYGGYSALALLTQSYLFKAGVAADGISDLESFNGFLSSTGDATGLAWNETGQGLMGASLWENRTRYTENSPLTYFERIQAPVLLVHGALDSTSPVSQSDAAFVALRRLGKEVEYRRYGTEGHVITGPEQLTDYWNAVIRWFDRYLKP
jgi:dipeptidyl aminopeptidase/acylaminoacyl peptidase